MPNVYELTLGYQNITLGNPLVFPNILTCMAMVASNGANLVGVHFTQADQSTLRVNGAWGRAILLLNPGPYSIYVAGPGWNANLLANMAPLPASFRGAATAAGIDVQATLLPTGAVTMEIRPHAGGPWAPLVMVGG